MPKIHKLSPHEAQKIAAGEVVERPANVLKELVENAIDAGATHIIIYLEEAGKELIRVVDNGCGMDKEDALLCFEHHATSKITSVNDLESINTFGFRGEALSSISSISKTTLITKEKNAEYAHKISLESNKTIETSIVSANSGTDISVRDIFYNVPARKKFLKSTETEWNQIKQLFHAACLDYLDIHFQLHADEKLMYNCPIVDSLQQRIMQLWDVHIAENIISLNEQCKDGIKISGVISNHHFARYDRNSIFFFANKRWVKHQKLTSALLKGYLNVIQPGKFPAAAIFIEVDPLHIDVNIHPRKEEVQFLHPKKIEMMLGELVKEALEVNLSAQLKKKVVFAPVIEMQHFNQQPLPAYVPHSMKNKFSTINENHFVQDPLSKSPKNSFVDVQNTIASPERAENQETVRIDAYDNNYQLIGQLHKTYILLEKDEGLYIVDQHAAHERILYELFAKRFEDVATVKLLFPQIIPLTHESIIIFEPAIALFQSHGIELSIISQTELAVQSTPVHLKNQSLNDLVHEVIAWISENKSVDTEHFFAIINEKIRAQMACKAAVKAGDILTHEQMQQLLDDLHKANNRFSCPHGRPTGWLLSKYEIEKKFKRKL